MLKEYKHYQQEFTVKVDTRKGKITTNKTGMVTLIGNSYKSLNIISIDIFNRVFVPCKKEK